MYSFLGTNFEVGGLFEVELEFRTSEMNGILLSIAEPEGYPALSLELDGGKVKKKYVNIIVSLFLLINLSRI